MRIVRRRRRSPWALDKGNLRCVIGQASNRTRASSETKRDAPRQSCRWCRTAVELSIVVTGCARLARESIYARVVGGSKAHLRSRSGGRRGGGAGDATIVIRRVCGIVVTVYMVVPLRLIRKMATIFLVMRAIRFIVSAVADRACLSTSVCVIVAKLAKFKAQAATRSNEKMPTTLEDIVVFVAVEAKPPVFSEGISAR